MSLKSATEWLMGAAMTWRDRWAGPPPVSSTERYVEDIEQRNLNDAALAYLAARERNEEKKLARRRRVRPV